MWREGIYRGLREGAYIQSIYKWWGDEYTGSSAMIEYEVIDVYFPDGVRDKIRARGIDEDMVLRALVAGDKDWESPPLVTGEWSTSDGDPDIWALARDAISGMYIEIGFVLEPDGTARCYHVLRMSEADRRRYRRARG